MQEYELTEDAYNDWCQSSIIMNRYAYYSIFKEIEKEGLQGKTFLEVGCGPCPIGVMLAKNGAKKIIGLDLSPEMLESVRKHLTKLQLIDKFELICSDILDEDFALDEKVDCVIFSYMLTTFVMNEELLSRILKICRKQMKPDGFMVIADFSYCRIDKEDLQGSMYTETVVEDQPPSLFEPFNFMIDKAPGEPFRTYNIPSYMMFSAGYKAGFNLIECGPQYPDPAVSNDPMIRKYIDVCKPHDYILKLRVKEV